MSTGVPESTLTASTKDGAKSVFISKWVNKAFPPWDQILTAHDVARLTRRHPWELWALTLVRRFPKRCRFHGRAIGWLRSDVLGWISDRSGVQKTVAVKTVRTRASKDSRQGRLPLDSVTPWMPPRGCARLSNTTTANPTGGRS